MIVWDKWQEDVLLAEGNLVACCGRQVGKSEVISEKSARYIVRHPGKKVLIISVTEAQAEMMLAKIVLRLYDLNSKLICRGVKKPTKHKCELTNGSIVITKAVGQYGLGALGLTCDVVIVDECAYMPETIWPAITPMLLTTGGELWLLSTPNAQGGYFYQAFTDPVFGFKTFHVNSEEVASNRPEPLRSLMLRHLEREKARMSTLEYAQQYLAQFQEELGQLFSDDLIIKCQTLKRLNEDLIHKGAYYLGMDIARMGGDETTFEILEKRDKKYLQREHMAFKYTFTTHSIQKALELNALYDFKNIYVDSGGLGVAVSDQLLTLPSTKKKVVEINNASRSIESSSSTNRTRRLLKEDLYMNLLRMMEAGEIELLDDLDIFTSLKSIMIEHDVKKANIFIHGRYSHIAEGLIRSAWANHSTRLELWVR